MFFFSTPSFDPTPIRFDYIGSLQEYVVPQGCKKLQIECVAAKGNDGNAKGGKGGKIECILDVKSTKVLYLWVGQTHSNFTTPEYNASDIRYLNDTDILSETALSSRIIVAGAGGDANATNYASNGGDGGGLIGGSSNGYGTAATGGTQTEGGTGGTHGAAYLSGSGKADNGSFGLGAPGKNHGAGYGGCGGAGYFGGGGGSTCYVNKLAYTNGVSGAGGSSYSDSNLCTEVIHTQGFNDSNGYIIITPVV